MIGGKSEAVLAFWEACRRARGLAADHFHACTLSDPRFLEPGNEHLDLSDQPALILARRKRGTAHMLIDFTRNGIPLREVGDYWVLLNGDSSPMCLVRVSDVSIVPFIEVPATWAAMEGEGDETLEWWREAHRAYFLRQCRLWGVEWREDTPVVCEAWELIAQPE